MKKKASTPARMSGDKLQTVDRILARLQALRPSLPPTGQRIADFIVNNSSDVVHMSVTEVADRTNASEGSVVGLCQKLGTSGFQHLKISLAQDLVKPIQFIHEDLDKKDEYTKVVEKVFQSDIQAIQDTMSVLDSDDLGKAVEMILKAERVELYGIGSSAPIVEDAHYRMLRIGINCKVVIDSHIQAISAALTGRKVATLTVSHSGSTVETVTATKLAKEAGAGTICITNYGKSPIQAYSDVVLYTMARETQFRTEAMTSRIAQLSIVDALIACLALKNYKKSVETIQHTFSVLSGKRY